MARRILVNTIGRVASELGSVYRRAKRGQIDWQDAVAAARVLKEIRCCLESGNIEARTAALELALEQALEAQKANGYRPTSSPSPYHYRQ